MILRHLSNTVVLSSYRRAWSLSFCLFFLALAGPRLAHATAPKITGLSVNSGAVKASVTISGQNFGTSRGSSTVAVNGAAVTTYGTWTATSVKVDVPLAAITKGDIVVTVGGVKSNGWPFVVIPSVTGLSLTAGPQNMGFDIQGYTFGTDKGTSTVKIGETALTVLPDGWRSTKIAVQVPADAATGAVTVTVDDNASNSKTFTVETYGCD